MVKSISSDSPVPQPFSRPPPVTKEREAKRPISITPSQGTKYQITFDSAISQLDSSTQVKLRDQSIDDHMYMKVSDIAGYLDISSEDVIRLIQGKNDTAISSLIEKKDESTHQATGKKTEPAKAPPPVEQQLPSKYECVKEKVKTQYQRLVSAGITEEPVVPREAAEKRTLPGDSRSDQKDVLGNARKKEVSAHIAPSGHTYVVLKDIKIAKGAEKNVFLAFSSAQELAAVGKWVFNPKAGGIPSQRFQIIEKNKFLARGSAEIEKNQDMVGAEGIVQMKHFVVSESKKTFAGEQKVPIPKFQMVMEFRNAGDLNNFLNDKNHPQRTDENLYNILTGIGVGLMSLKTYSDKGPINHHDIKPGNISLEEKDGVLNAKILDLGMAKYQTEDDNNPNPILQGSLFYFPPEFVKGLDKYHETGKNVAAAKQEVSQMQLELKQKQNILTSSELQVSNLEHTNEMLVNTILEEIDVLEQNAIKQQQAAEHMVTSGILSNEDVRDILFKLHEDIDEGKIVNNKEIKELETKLREVRNETAFINNPPNKLTALEKKQQANALINYLHSSVSFQSRSNDLRLFKKNIDYTFDHPLVKEFQGNRKEIENLKNQLRVIKGEVSNTQDRLNEAVSDAKAISGLSHPNGDMWAVGIMLYQMRTGNLPDFVALTESGKKVKEPHHVQANLGTLTQERIDKAFSNPIEPGSLEELNYRLLSLEPDKRATAQEYSEAVNRLKNEKKTFQ